MNCINKNTKEFKTLQELTKQAPVLLALNIKRWQAKNNTNVIPSYEELTGMSSEVVNSFRADLSLSEIGSELEYFNYLKTTETPSNEGFREYVLDNTQTKDVVKVNEIFSKVTSNRNVNLNDLYSSDTNTFDNSLNKESIDSKFNELFLNSKSTATGIEVLNSILSNYGEDLNPTVKQFVNKLSKVKGLENVTFVIDNSIGNNVGQYDNETNTIKLNRDVLTASTVDYTLSTILHELVHYRTVEALMNPKQQEDFELKEAIKDVFDRFRNDDHYGFENEYEFVAEFYSNPEFRNDIKKEFLKEKDKESVFQKIYNAIRRLFGMAKTSEYDKLFNLITSYVETDLGTNTSFSSGLFNKRTDKTDYFDDINKFTNRISDLIQDNIDNQIKSLNTFISKSNTKNSDEVTDAKNKVKELKQIFKSFEDKEKFENFKAYVQYLNVINDQTYGLIDKVDKFDKTIDKPMELLNQIYRIEAVLTEYEIVEDFDDYYNTIVKDKIDVADVDSFDTFYNLIESVKSNKLKLEKSLHNYKKDYAISLISDPRFNTRVETIFRQKFEKEYGNGKGFDVSKSEYIKQRFEESKDEFKKSLVSSARDMVFNPKNDISKAELMVNSSLNINSDLFNVAINMVYDYRDKLEKSVTEEFRQIDKLYQEFKKENKGLGPSEKYKNLISQDKNGNYYLKNKFKIELMNSYRDMINEAHNELYGKRTPFKISRDEFNELKASGSGVLMRTELVPNVVAGVPVNVQHSDKTSSVTPSIDSITTYKKGDLTARDRVVTKYTEFNSYQELVDSKLYDTKESKGSKLNPELYSYLKGESDLIVYKYSRHEERSDFKKTKAYRTWLNDHFDRVDKLDEKDRKVKAYVVKDKFIDKSYQSLSEVEKKILDRFNQIGKRGTEVYSKFNSLDNEVMTSKYGDNVSFTRLPSSEKSTLERRFEKEFKGMYKDFKEGLKRNENDDYDISEPLDKEGKALYGLRVHNRGYIEPERQSLELFDLMSSEVENMIKHQQRKDFEKEMKVIADISAGKKYILKSTKTGKAARNSKRTKQPIQLFEGVNSNEYKKILGLMETAIYDIHSYNGGKLGNYEINKITGLINGLTASVALTMNAPTGIANVVNGRAQLQLDALGGYHYNSSDLASAEKTYFTELGNSLLDLNQPIKKSKVNLTLEYFDYIGGMSMKKQSYLKDTVGKKLLSTESSNAYNEMGEHYMGFVITDAILKGIKVMNDKGEFINKEGKVVKTKEEAASVSDMLIVEDGKMSIHPSVVYTSFTPTVKINEGGLAHIRMLIKKKSEDLYGSYDSNLKPEIQKTFWGKSVMMFKRFFIPGLQYRYRGYTNVLTHPNEMSEANKSYNTALKEHEEGYYITTVKLVLNTIKNLKAHGLKYGSDYYNNLSDYEKSNVRKTIAELTTRGILLPALGLMFALGWDDDEKPYWLMYQIARLSSELAQFSNPLELTKMATNPIAGLNFVQNALKLGGNILSVVNVDPDADESYFGWLDEDNKGNNKLLKSVFKVMPITSQLSKEYQNLYNQLK